MFAERLRLDKNDDTSEFTIMNQIVHSQFTDPRTFYPAIPEWLVTVLLKAIAKDKKSRIKLSGIY